MKKSFAMIMMAVMLAFCANNTTAALPAIGGLESGISDPGLSSLGHGVEMGTGDNEAQGADLENGSESTGTWDPKTGSRSDNTGPNDRSKTGLNSLKITETGLIIPPPDSPGIKEKVPKTANQAATGNESGEEGLDAYVAEFRQKYAIENRTEFINQAAGNFTCQNCTVIIVIVPCNCTA